MGDDLLLTIAIPTYNGGRTISRCIASIVPELQAEVELLVCDNASTDGTAEIVRKIAGSHPQIRLISNETNVGFDRNVELCMQRARGDFVWLIGDDDLICRPGAVEQVLQVIRAHPEVAAIFADSRHPIRLNTTDSGLCLNGSDFFRKSRFKSGLVSSNIFRRSAWQEIDLRQYIGSGWLHIGFLVQALARFPSYVICVETIAQLVLEEGFGIGRWGGTGSFLRTGLNLVRIYREMPSLGYDPAIVRAAYLTIKGGYLKNIPLAKAKGLRVDASLVREFVELYRAFPSFWLIDLPLLLLPGWLFRGARACSRALQGARGAHGE